MARVTLAQVAEEAGVSTCTVSQVLNGQAREKGFSQACAHRVRAAARALGYQSNYHARTLSRGKAMTLGFVTRFHDQDVSRPGVETGLTDRANQRGYEILNIVLPDSRAALGRAVQYVREKRLDGFAVFMGGWALPEITRTIPPDIPMMHIWFAPDGFEPVVTLDPAPGIVQGVAHLAELGHRGIAWVGVESAGRIEVPDRLKVLRRTAKASGIRLVEHYLRLDRIPRRNRLSVHGFYQQLAGTLETLNATTAAVCYNDMLAMALGAALRDRGICPGRDYSLIGFDDTQALHAVPPLTTVSHMFAEMGSAAVDLLEEMITGDRPRPSSVTRVASKLVIRQSTCLARDPLNL
jgi:LacI family transcriptional regulator